MIGGEHFVPAPACGPLEHELAQLMPHCAYASSGRDALWILARHLSAPTVWIPDFLCHSVYQAMADSGSQLRFYSVDQNLLPNLQSLDELQNGDALLIIAYFGIVPQFAMDYAHAKGARILADCTHMLVQSHALKDMVQKSEVALISLRKSGAFADGAYMGAHSAITPEFCGTRPDFWVPRAAALESRSYSAACDFVNDENFGLFRKAEEALDHSVPGPYSMSYLGLGHLRRFPLENHRQAVHSNSQILAQLLGKSLHCPTLAGSFESQYFPVICPTAQLRTQIRTALSKQQIFCPVHWDTSFLPKSHPISDLIFSIPTDQRYNAEQMEQIAQLILSQL